ncbi:PepSY domain-containing protein [Undibacterium cyanobacteriorum]|uniref:PepSY domain-containing protein n=1 Tax=Undibacterium cyanobacteriorum TaxID=3073561 RepID=A0ABY9RMI6_9BURK|nr:PepSY domain-containing protein [Undibacterium sp. 20NA77.5]WMW81900.1 PepSY domain-containing protein [Undibacterium sp. 20NA77.5]
MKSFWKRPANWFRWHRWLGYLIGLQLLAWIAGGLFFAIVPFQTAIKGKDLVAKPEAIFIQDWHLALQKLPTEHGRLLALQSVQVPQGTALRLQFENKTLLLDQRGSQLASPNQAQIETFARQAYRGGGDLVQAKLLTQVPTQLGMVKELAGRPNVWQVKFKDEQNTRLYFDGKTGEFITVRTDAWVWYDFFWRLHVMDYAEGEDFNNTLLRVATIFAMLMMVTGIVLSVRNLLRGRF